MLRIFAVALMGLALQVLALSGGALALDEKPSSAQVASQADEFAKQKNELLARLKELKSKIDGAGAVLTKRANAPAAAQEAIAEMRAVVSPLLSAVADNGDLAQLGSTALKNATDRRRALETDGRFSPDDRLKLVEAPAMSEEDCARAIAYGMMAVEPGIDVLAVGEMGIANTTVAAALSLALFGGDAGEGIYISRLQTAIPAAQADPDWAASVPAPSSAAAITMRASRGGKGRRRRRLPVSVSRPSASLAPSSASKAFASARAARGGGSRNASCAASAPQAARSSAKDERSALRISGRPKGSSEAVCGSSHSR